MENRPIDSAEPERRPIRFWHADKLVELDQVPPTLTVLEWLRETATCTGVKEGCAEGDCGACTVSVTRLDAQGGLQVQAVNACIQFVATLDGKQLTTAQDLAPAACMHPVQQALVDHHGSQCGFCTPGFVMSLHALYETRRASDDRRVTRAQAIEAVSGNLCRCTGYRPILDAAQAMCNGPWAGADPATLRERLLQIAPQTDTVFGGQPVASAYPGHGEGRFFAPRTLASFAALRMQLPDSRIVAGATDVGLWVTKQHRQLGDVLWIPAVTELDTVVEVNDARSAELWGEATACLEIGAAVSVSRAWSVLTPHLPECSAYFDRFASRPVRNAATLVGNLANGSPIGDAPALLIALGATLVLHRGGQERTLALEDFYLGYQKNALAAGEFVRAVRVPLPGDDVKLGAWKVSKRLEQDITAVAIVTAVQLAQDRVARVRIGVGGMAAVPSRAPLAEQAWIGAVVGGQHMPAEVLAAMAAIRQEFTPLDDMRASAAYRSEVAANLLHRSWLRLAGAAPAARSLAGLEPILVEASA